MHKFRLNADGKMLTGIFNLIYAQQIIGLGLTHPGAQVPNSAYPKRPLFLFLILPYCLFMQIQNKMWYDNDFNHL